ncbi:hypothetical protein ACPWT1_18370 [Ramlibacter sp. MMS24-I3-19]
MRSAPSGRTRTPHDVFVGKEMQEEQRVVQSGAKDTVARAES